jgi:hypothetical protein
VIEYVLAATLYWQSPATGDTKEREIEGTFGSFRECMDYVQRRMFTITTAWNVAPLVEGTVCEPREKVQAKPLTADQMRRKETAIKAANAVDEANEYLAAERKKEALAAGDTARAEEIDRALARLKHLKALELRQTIEYIERTPAPPASARKTTVTNENLAARKAAERAGEAAAKAARAAASAAAAK